MAVQWLRLHTPTAGGAGLTPGRGTKIPRATWHDHKKKKKKKEMHLELQRAFLWKHTSPMWLIHIFSFVSQPNHA